jgi:oligoendopeptidase F
MSEKLNTELGTAAVIWRLEDLYQGANDPALAADLAACEEEAKAIRDQFAGRLLIWTPPG